MKRIVLSIAIVLTLGISASAQSESFFSSSYSDVNRESNELVLPGMPARGMDGNTDAPIGSGLLLLAGMGAAYALRKKND